MFHVTILSHWNHALRGLWAQMRLSFMASLQYRANTVLSFFSVAVSSAVEVTLWWMVLQRRGEVQGYGLEELLIYLVAANVTGMLRVNWDSVMQFSEEIRTGAVIRHLLKPIPLVFVFSGDWLARKLPIALGSIPVFFGLYFWRPLIFHPNSAHILAYLGFLALSLWMSAEIYYLIVLAAFWVDENSGVAIAFNVLGWGFLGVAFPLSFYPVWVQRVLDATPLPYLVYYPVMVLLGRLPAPMILLRFMAALFMGFALRYLRRVVGRLAESRLQTVGG